MKKKSEYFTFDEVSLDDESTAEGLPRQGSISDSSIELIQQPPFFRTRDLSAPVHPSRCYALPKHPCIVEEPVVEVFDNVTKLFRIPKGNNKCIKFIGVDAVSYEETDPVTQLKPLAKTICDAIFLKTERESVVVIEDEETLRNDNLLSAIDEMSEDDEQVIPTGRLRSYLHHQAPQSIFNFRVAPTLAADYTDSSEDSEVATHIPKVFTFDVISDSDTSSFVEPADAEVIEEASDSASASNRLSLAGLDVLSRKRSESFEPVLLRSPRLSTCSPRVNLSTPKLMTGRMGAATVRNDRVSFFHSLHSPPLEEMDVSPMVMRRLSLSEEVKKIRSFCYHANDSLCKFQTQLQSIMSSEEHVMTLFGQSLIQRRYSLDSDIDNLQYDVRKSITELAKQEGDYSINMSGYIETELQLQETIRLQTDHYSQQLSFFGWNVVKLEAAELILVFPCGGGCSLKFRFWTKNFISVYSSLVIESNDSWDFMKVVQSSGLKDSVRKDFMYHELYDYFHHIWYLCYRVADEYKKIIHRT